MLISPLTFISSLLFGTALTYLVAARWPRAIYHTALSVVGIGLIAWLLLGRELPQSASVGEWTNSLFIPLWVWQGDEAIWLLSGMPLLMVFSLLLFRAGRVAASSSRVNHFNWRLHRSEWQPILMLSLVAASLSAIWASALITLMMSWTLVAVFWALYLLTTSDESAHLSSVSQRAFWMLVPLLFAGIAAAAKPLGSDLLDMGSWSTAAIIAIALTSMAQMGIMPFVGWRPRMARWQPDDGPVLYLIPPLVGAGLLLRLAASTQIEPGAILLLTGFALYSILSGVRGAWANLRSTSRPPADLALSLSGLAFLAAMWAGAGALLAAVQLLVFAITILFLLENLPISRTALVACLSARRSVVSLGRFSINHRLYCADFRVHCLVKQWSPGSSSCSGSAPGTFDYGMVDLCSRSCRQQVCCQTTEQIRNP